MQWRPWTLPSLHGTLRPFGVTPGLTESAPYRRDLGQVLEKLIARIRHSAMQYVFPLRQSHFRWNLSTGHCAQEVRCLADIITCPLIVTSSRSQWSTPLCPFEDIGGFVYRLSMSGNFRVAFCADPFLNRVHHCFEKCTHRLSVSIVVPSSLLVGLWCRKLLIVRFSF